MPSPVPVRASAPVLLRQLGIVSATALVVSNMVGTGIFTTTGFLAGDLGSPSLVLWIWMVGAICALMGAVCYSELGVNFPSSGGEYVYLTQAYGPTWGFMSGWVSFFAGFSAPIATVAIAFSSYLGYFFPQLKQENAHVLFGSGDWTFVFGPGQLLACALILSFTILNILGVQRAARVQNTITSMKVLVMLSFIVFGFLVGNGNAEHFSMNAVRTSTSSLPAQFAVSLFFLYFSYSGWNAATYVAEELRHPSFTLPAALGIGTALVAALYLGLNVIFIYAAPLEDHEGATCGRVVCRLPALRPQRRRNLQRIDGAFPHVHGERHGHHRPSRLLRDGQEWSLPGSGGEPAPQVAHAGDGHHRAKHLRHVDDHDSVPATGDLYRLHVEHLRRDECRLPAAVPQTGRLAQAPRGEFRLPAASRALYPCGRVDDHLRSPDEADRRRRGCRDHRNGGPGLSHPLAQASAVASVHCRDLLKPTY